jgi:hypothetical protein
VRLFGIGRGPTKKPHGLLFGGIGSCLFPGALAAIVCHAPLVRADVEPIGIDYAAPEGCPSADEFTKQVLERTDSATLSRDPRVRTFVVVIERNDEGVRGELAIREADGTSSLSRTLSGSHCAEVAMALALATALAIDPQASFAPREHDSPEPSPPEPPPPHPPDPIDSIDKARRSADRRALAVSVGPATLFGVAPVASFGAVIAGETETETFWLASLGVELSLLTAPSASTGGARSAFDLAHARPKVCVFSVPARGALRVLPCAGVELGVLRARGSDLPRPSEATRFWAAGTVGPRLRWELDSAWFVDLNADAILPFTRYSFVFENPETSIHRVPNVALEVSLRFGARL